MSAKPVKATKNKTAVKTAPPAGRLLSDVRGLILSARKEVARVLDSGVTMLYWHVGRRIRQDILKEKRAVYGGQIVAALGRQLEMEFGRGFGMILSANCTTPCCWPARGLKDGRTDQNREMMH